MRRFIGSTILVLTIGFGFALANETPDELSGARTLTGEVVDVLCYLQQGEQALGEKHAACANRCIQKGLPVAVKVGDQLYLATMASHESANMSLANLAGQQVTVHGNVTERDGQALIAIEQIEVIE